MNKALQENPQAITKPQILEDQRSGAESSLTAAAPVENNLARLARSADSSPATRHLRSLQRKADARASSSEAPKPVTRHSSRVPALTQLKPRAERADMTSSRAAMTASLHPENTLGPALLDIPGGDEIALQRIATTSEKPLPGRPTAKNSPVLDAMGMSATSMSNAEYKRWSGTIQCKMGMHGKHQVGGQTIVTQFKPNADIVQRKSFFQKHKAKFNAGLVMFEAALTVAAAIVGITVATNTGALNLMLSSVAGAVVGVIKMIRGIMMMQQAFAKEKSAWVTKAIDVIRSLEAAGAAIALFLAAPTSALTIVTGLIFTASKGLRSLSVEYSNDVAAKIKALEAQEKEGKADQIAALKKKQGYAKSIAAVCHWIEVAALAVGGSGKAIEATIEAAKTGATLASTGTVLGGAAANTVATSKEIRASGLLAPDNKSDPSPNLVTAKDPVAAPADPKGGAPKIVPQIEAFDEGDIGQ